MFGEEDAISLDGLYTTTAICNSLTGSVYAIKTEDFLTLKNSELSWNKILSKSLWRETQKSEKQKIHVNLLEKYQDKTQDVNFLLQNSCYYDISPRNFEDLKVALKKMDGLDRDY